MLPLEREHQLSPVLLIPIDIVAVRNAERIVYVLHPCRVGRNDVRQLVVHLAAESEQRRAQL